MRYTHFVFDIDNTLISTTGAMLHGLQRTLRDVTGEHWDLSRFTPVLGMSGLDTLERLGMHSPEQMFQIYPHRERYEQEYQYIVYLYEGVAPLLSSLRKKGCVLGVITSKTMSQYTSSFLPFQIPEYFQTVITADDTIRHKPDPGPILAYMGRTGICPRRIPYIEDSIYDV